MKIEWLVTNIAPVGSPDRVERDFFVMWTFFGLGYGHLTKTEWSMADVTVIATLARAERPSFWVIFDIILPIQVTFEGRHFLVCKPLLEP